MEDDEEEGEEDDEDDEDDDDAYEDDEDTSWKVGVGAGGSGGEVVVCLVGVGEGGELLRGQGGWQQADHHCFVCVCVALQPNCCRR